MKYIFLILGLVSIVGNADAMHVTKSKNFAGKKNTASKPFRAPKIKTQAPAKKTKELAAQLKQVNQVKKDYGKFPVIQENKKPAQAPQVEQAERTEEQVKRDKEEQANLEKELRELKAKTVKFMELCKSDDEKTVEVARDYFKNLWMWSNQQSILKEAFRNPDVKNPKMLLMLLRAITPELRHLNLSITANPNELFAWHIRDFGRLLQEKFIQAVHTNNINLVHFLLLELKPNAKQAGSLIYPETIKKSRVYEWVYQTFDKQGTSAKLEAILTYVAAAMSANNAQEQEILAQDKEALNKALENLCLFVAEE